MYLKMWTEYESGDIMLENDLRQRLLEAGAVLVGYGDLSGIPEEKRSGLPVGVGVAVLQDPKVIQGILEGPTKDYLDWYNKLNEKLDALVTLGAGILTGAGYRAVAQTRNYVNWHESDDFHTLLPHKTIATRTGLGWIGKCALLVTKEYGSMIRISSILTDAPLPAAEPVNESACGVCENCRRACPAGAVSGRMWDVEKQREEFWDAEACAQTARKITREKLGAGQTICGRCIAVCPWTQKYMRKHEVTGENSIRKD
jgi:epoxyqueuosine reductase QueG